MQMLVPCFCGVAFIVTKIHGMSIFIKFFHKILRKSKNFFLHILFKFREIWAKVFKNKKNFYFSPNRESISLIIYLENRTLSSATASRTKNKTFCGTKIKRYNVVILKMI
jgi:hypothetical protein